MPRAKGQKCRHCHKHSHPGEEYCRNHVVPCSAPGCPNRLRAGGVYCVKHLDFGRTPCRAEGCTKLATPGATYCGNHASECLTDGCGRRTREGGYCTVCKDRNANLPGCNPRRTAGAPNQHSTSNQLRQLIRGYEAVQGEQSLRGQIAKDRLPVLREQLTMLQGVR